MVVWGGISRGGLETGRYAPGRPVDVVDADGDGFSECQGDCDDGNANVYPGAPEVVDALDNDCDGVIDNQADLSIAKSDSPDPVDTGATLTYVLAVNNAGPDPASYLVVTDTLPAGTTFQCASGSGACGAADGWTCNEAAGMVTCTRTSLAVGAAPNIIIMVTAPAAGGTINNTASVTSTAADPSAANITNAKLTRG